MNASRMVPYLICCSLLGCTAISYEHKTADGILAAETIAIVRNPAVDDQFVDALAAWFKDRGLRHQIVDQPPTEGWSLSYQASWSWDISFYLSDVRVGAHRNRSEVGHATYNVFAGAWSINMSKWQSDETVVKELMERLYGTGSSASRAALSPEAPGTVLLTSNVNGARIYVDGAFVGNSPATLNLAVGQHLIRFCEGDKPFHEETLSVTAGSQATLRADKPK